VDPHREGDFTVFYTCELIPNSAWVARG